MRFCTHMEDECRIYCWIFGLVVCLRFAAIFVSSISRIPKYPFLSSAVFLLRFGGFLSFSSPLTLRPYAFHSCKVIHVLAFLGIVDKADSSF